MNRVLLVLSSPRGVQSHSQAIARRLVADIAAREPDTMVMERDLAREPLPHLSEAFVSGLFKSESERTHEESAEIARSDALVDELLAADTIVIAAPMHNFGIPSTLKAWIDHVARAGRTFRYTASGAEGLVKGKRVILVVARGGVYTKGPASALEFQESYLRGVLGFLGLTDVQTIHVEGVGMGKAAADEAIQHATVRAGSLARTIAGDPLRVAA